MNIDYEKGIMYLFDQAKEAMQTVVDDVINDPIEAWKKYTPAGQIYKRIDEAAQHHIHIANASNQSISVIVSPEKYWAMTDLTASIATLIISFGSSAPAGLTALKNATTLYEIFQAIRYLRGATGVISKIWHFFSEHGLVIKSHEYECVNKRSKTNPLNYLSPSQYGSLTGYKTIAILIVMENGQSLYFESNTDHSWIIYPDRYCRAKYGTLWQPENYSVPSLNNAKL